MKTDRKVLFVDDEQNILDTFRASLRRHLKVQTALGPKEGLKTIKENGPFAVVVSDLKMPEMDGITFLSKVQELSPDTVRIMLTGHADVTSAISAVNEGAVFRFLTKPTPADIMLRTLELALNQYSLVVAERELLRGTLRGSIKVLTDILALINPEAFGRSERIKRLANKIGQQLQLTSTLHLDLSAMLCQLGCVTLTDTVMDKVYKGESLSGEEKQVFDMHPSITSGMLSQIPRMERVAEIIQHQNDTLEANPKQPFESRILKICQDYDSFIQQGHAKQDSIEFLRKRQGWYDPKVLDALEMAIAGEEGYVRRELNLIELRPGMILEQGLWSKDDVHIMAEGTEVTETAMIKIRNFSQAQRLPLSIKVLVPIQQAKHL